MGEFRRWDGSSWLDRTHWLLARWSEALARWVHLAETETDLARGDIVWWFSPPMSVGSATAEVVDANVRLTWVNRSKRITGDDDAIEVWRRILPDGLWVKLADLVGNVFTYLDVAPAREVGLAYRITPRRTLAGITKRAIPAETTPVMLDAEGGGGTTYTEATVNATERLRFGFGGLDLPRQGQAGAIERIGLNFGGLDLPRQGQAGVLDYLHFGFADLDLPRQGQAGVIERLPFNFADLDLAVQAQTGIIERLPFAFAGLDLSAQGLSGVSEMLRFMGLDIDLPPQGAMPAVPTCAISHSQVTAAVGVDSIVVPYTVTASGGAGAPYTGVGTFNDVTVTRSNPSQTISRTVADSDGVESAACAATLSATFEEAMFTIAAPSFDVEPGGIVSRSCSAENEQGAVTYEKTDGHSWITVSALGLVRAAPPAGTAEGDNLYSVRGTDAGNNVADDSAVVTVTFAPLVVTAPDFEVEPGDVASRSCTSVGGQGAVTYALAGFAHPDWLSVSALGLVRAAPPAGTATGDVTYGVIGTDAVGNFIGAFGTITVTSTPLVVTAPDFEVEPGDVASRSCTSVGGQGAVTYALAGFAHPDWLSVSALGLVRAAPPAGTATGDVTYGVIGTDAVGNFIGAFGTITVTSTPLVVTAPDFEVEPGDVASRSCTSVGGQGAVTYALAGFAHPDWLSVSALGLVRAAPPAGTATGDVTYGVIGTDAVGNFIGAFGTITIA